MANFVQPCDEIQMGSGAPVTPCTKSLGRWILAATILGSSMAFIDGTVVNVALPALQANLHATVIDVQWVVEAYSLFLSALLLVGGSLGDHYGRRRVFLIGVAIFTLASVWCGCAPDIRHLISARALQGMGAALLVPGSLAIISASFHGEERGRAIGVWSGFTAITAAIGPVIGGWLIEKISWRAVFFINVPLALLVSVIALRFVPESSSENSKGHLDWVGALLTTLGLGALVYGLIESSRLGVRHPAVLLGLVGGIACLFAFVILEQRSQNPMLPMSIFRSRNFSGANLLTLLLYAALGGTLFFVPMNLIQIQHYSATAAGASLLPFILIMFLLSRWSGGLVQRYGAKLPLIIGPVIAAAGFALFIRPGVGANYWTQFFPAVCVLGLGMAISVAPLTTTVMNAVTEDRIGIASGVNNAVSRAAGLLAIAVLGVVMLHTFNYSLDQKLSAIEAQPATRHSLDDQRINLAAIVIPEQTPPVDRESIRRAIDESFVDGFRRVMLTGAILALASAFISWFLIDGRSPKNQTEGNKGNEGQSFS